MTTLLPFMMAALLCVAVPCSCAASDAVASAEVESAQPGSTTVLIPDSPAVVSQELPIKYWGNSFSGKFHRPSCAFAKAMSARHVIFFHFRREAIESGEIPCRYCLPPFIKRVECKLLPKIEVPEPQAPANESQSGFTLK